MAAACLGASGVSLAAAGPAVPSREPSFLAFLDAPSPGRPILTPPHLSISFGGETHRAVVDTGSTGVVVSASSIPELARLPVLGPGEITYTSSGRIIAGTWVLTKMRISGSVGSVEAGPLPVLVVTAVRCTASARRRSPADRPTGISMLGIGFGREHDRQPEGTPDRNPILAVGRLPPGVSRGFALSAWGISIGAPRDSTGYAVVSLECDSEHGDWRAPSACVTVGSARPACGTVLVNTGVAGMFLTVPMDRLPGAASAGAPAELPSGTRIAVDLAPGGGSAGYAFAVNDRTDPVAPASVTLAGIGRRPTFVNTGVRLLNGFDYFYDAAGGRVGYRPIGRQQMSPQVIAASIAFFGGLLALLWNGSLQRRVDRTRSDQAEATARATSYAEVRRLWKLTRYYIEFVRNDVSGKDGMIWLPVFRTMFPSKDVLSRIEPLSPEEVKALTSVFYSYQEATAYIKAAALGVLPLVEASKRRDPLFNLNDDVIEYVYKIDGKFDDARRKELLDRLGDVESVCAIGLDVIRKAASKQTRHPELSALVAYEMREVAPLPQRYDIPVRPTLWSSVRWYVGLD